jgi:hypothetical protein
VIVQRQITDITHVPVDFGGVRKTVLAVVLNRRSLVCWDSKCEQAEIEIMVAWKDWKKLIDS